MRLLVKDEAVRWSLVEGSIGRRASGNSDMLLLCSMDEARRQALQLAGRNAPLLLCAPCPSSTYSNTTSQPCQKLNRKLQVNHHLTTIRSLTHTNPLALLFPCISRVTFLSPHLVPSCSRLSPCSRAQDGSKLLAQQVGHETAYRSISGQASRLLQGYVHANTSSSRSSPFPLSPWLAPRATKDANPPRDLSLSYRSHCIDTCHSTIQVDQQ